MNKVYDLKNLIKFFTILDQINRRVLISDHPRFKNNGDENKNGKPIHRDRRNRTVSRADN